MGNAIADIPTQNNHLATKEYVDTTVVSAGGTEDLYGKTCPEGFVHAGYNGDGTIHCTEITTGETGGSININFTDGISDGSGHYFTVGGGDHFCLQYTVDGSGATSFTDINNNLRCQLTGGYTCWDAQCLETGNGGDNYCRDYNLGDNTYANVNDMATCSTDFNFCKDGNCIGGPCTVPDGDGFESIINYGGEQWAGCSHLTCHYAISGKVPRHVANGGSDPDDICDDVVYATTVDASSGVLGGHAWSADVGYISLQGIEYGVSLPSGLVSGDVTGYAWSPEIGYINFCNSGAGYCVHYDAPTDQLSGYAWSPDVGYIRFDGTDVNGDSLIDYGAFVDRNVNRVQGTVWNPEIGYIRFTEEADPAYYLESKY